jgi:hypothetical protein
MPHARIHLRMRVAVGVMLLFGVSAAAQDVKINIGLGVPLLP